MNLSYYHKIVIIAAVGIFFTNIPVYVHFFFKPSAPPKYWVFAFCIMSLPILATRQILWNAFRSPVALWGWGYALLTLLWFLPSSQTDVVMQDMRLRLLAIAEILLFLAMFLEPDAVRIARKTLMIAVCTAVALNIYELFYPMSFSNTLGRSAGFYINPTMAGEALVLGMILSITLLLPRYRVPYMLIVGIGVLVTFSRSGIAAWIVAVVGFLLVGHVSLKHLFFSMAVGVLLILFALLPYADELLTTLERSDTINADVQERLEWLADPSGVSDYSSWERRYVAQQAWTKISERPLLGSGTGSYYEAPVPPHNQYLAFMLDHGLIGIFILPLLALAATWGASSEHRHVAIIFSCALGVLSLSSHTILTDSYVLLIISLMAAMAWTSGYGQIKASEAMGRREMRGNIAAVNC